MGYNDFTMKNLNGSNKIKDDFENINTNDNNLYTAGKNHVNGTADRHNSSGIDDDSNVIGATQKEVNESLQGQLDSISTADSNATIGVYSATDAVNTNNYEITIVGLNYFNALNIDLTVLNPNTSSATLNLNGLGAKSIKIKKIDNSKVDVSPGDVYGISRLKYDGDDFILINGNVPETTPSIYNTTSIFTVGKGKDEQSNDIDYSSSVVKGQVNVGVNGLSIIQDIINGDFSNGTTGWGSGGGSILVSNNEVEVTGNIANSETYLYYLSNLKYSSGDKLFFYYKAKSSFATTTDFVLFGDGGIDTETSIPISSSFTEISFIKTASYPPQLTNNLRFDNNCINTTNSTFFKNFIAINMTALGIESYTEEQMVELARMGYWEGVKSTLPVRLKSVNKNLFDKSTALIGRSLNNGNSVELDSNEYAHSDFIRIDNSKDYKLSGRIQTTINYHDSNKKFLRQTTGTDNVTPSNGEVYIRFNIHPGDLDTAQIEEGTVATNYTKHEFSEMYVNLPEGEELRSLPNGVKDEIKDGKLYKRISNTHTLQSSDIEDMFIGLANVDIARVPWSKLANVKIPTAAYSQNNQYDVHGKSPTSIADDVNSIGKWYASTTHLTFVFTKGTTLEDARNQLTGLTLTYQLATEQITNIPTTPLIAYPKGTIIIEAFLRKAIKYNSTTGNGLDFSYPLSEVEKIEDINENEIEEANITLSVDGLSVAIAGAVDGEVYTVYGFIRPEESTIPETLMSFVMNTQGQIEGNNAMINLNSKSILSLQDQVAMLIVINT